MCVKMEGKGNYGKYKYTSCKLSTMGRMVVVQPKTSPKVLFISSNIKPPFREHPLRKNSVGRGGLEPPQSCD